MDISTPPLTVYQAIDKFLVDRFSDEKNARTRMTYKYILNKFTRTLEIDTRLPLSGLTANHAANFIDRIAQEELSSNYRQLCRSCLISFYRYLEGEELIIVNLTNLRDRLKERLGSKGVQDVIFPEKDIERLIEYAEKLTQTPTEDENERLRLYRDRALIMTLADTGLRIAEACRLTRGDIDYDNYRLHVLGKGNKKALVRISREAIAAIRKYLGLRASLDGASGKQLSSLPVFARHDRGAGRKVKGIATETGRNILEEHVAAALGKEKTGTITPHKLRHRFVTKVLRSTKNLKMAQELARHKSISSTQRYAHLSDEELDQAYEETFDNG